MSILMLGFCLILVNWWNEWLPNTWPTGRFTMSADVKGNPDIHSTSMIVGMFQLKWWFIQTIEKNKVSWHQSKEAFGHKDFCINKTHYINKSQKDFKKYHIWVWIWILYLIIYFSLEDINNDWTISPPSILNCFCLNEAPRQTSVICLVSEVPGECTSGDAKHCTVRAPLNR